MRHPPILPALTVCTLLLANACTNTDTGYPSLLPRPIETRDDAEPVRPEPQATPDAALDAQIAAQRELAAAAAKRFAAAAISAETRVAVARGVPIGSESWLAAQAALAELAPIVGETASIVSTLEEVAVARAQGGSPAYPALDAAIAELGSRASAQAERAAALESALDG